MHNLNQTIIFFLLIVLFPCISIAGQKAPEGWRFPNETDDKGDWQNFIAEIPEPFHVHADFNGDGVEDDAWILINIKNGDWKLFVFLNNNKKPSRVVPLLTSTIEPGTKPQNYGIKLVYPGKYITACGKGYWECGPEEVPELNLTLPAISFFKYESFEWYYYWDKQTGAFKSIAIQGHDNAATFFHCPHIAVFPSDILID